MFITLSVHLRLQHVCRDAVRRAGSLATADVHQTATSRFLKAKFYYDIWSQTGTKLVADLQRAGIWPII